jgi:hypothetical protein
MKKYLYQGAILAVSIKDLFNNGSCGNLVDAKGDYLKAPDQNTIFLQACNAISGLINWVFIAAGFLAVIFVIYGGFTLLTSGGDSSKIETGKKMIMWAVVGIVVVAFAKFAVYFVIQLLHTPYSVPQS